MNVIYVCMYTSWGLHTCSRIPCQSISFARAVRAPEHTQKMSNRPLNAIALVPTQQEQRSTSIAVTTHYTHMRMVQAKHMHRRSAPTIWHTYTTYIYVYVIHTHKYVNREASEFGSERNEMKSKTRTNSNQFLVRAFSLWSSHDRIVSTITVCF